MILVAFLYAKFDSSDASEGPEVGLGHVRLNIIKSIDPVQRINGRSESIVVIQTKINASVASVVSNAHVEGCMSKHFKMR